MLTVIDEFTRRCLTIVVARRLKSDDSSSPTVHPHVRSDSGPEFVARNVRTLLAKIGVKSLYIETGSHHERRPLRELQLPGAGAILDATGGQVLIERWRCH